MPRLPVLDDRPTPRPQRGIIGIGGPTPADHDLRTVGRAYDGYAQVGDELRQFGSAELRRRMEDDARLEYATARAAFVKGKAEADTADYGDDYATYETRYGEALKGAKNTALGMVQSPRARQLLELEIGDDEVRGLAGIRDRAKAKEGDFGRASMVDTLATFRQSYLTGDPATRTSALQASRDAIAGARAKGYIDAEAAAILSQKTAIDFVGGWLDTLPPTERLAELQGRNASILPADMRVAMAERAQAQIDRDNAEAERVRNAEFAQLRSGVTAALDDGEADIAANGDTMIPELQPGYIRMAYADRPEEAEELIAALDRAKKFSGEAKKVAMLPPETFGELITSYAPSGRNAAEEASRQEMLAKAWKDRQEAIAKDPAAYVLTHSPELQAAWQAAQEDPTQVQKAVALSDQLQQQVSGGAIQPRVLPEAKAKAIVSEFTKQPDATKVVQMLDQYRAAYGKQWDRVSAELQDADLPRAAAVIDATWNDPLFRDALVQGIQVGKDELKKATEAKGLKFAADIEEPVAAALSELSATFVSPEIGNTYRDAAETVAMVYMGQGMDPASAVEKAAAAINSQYQIATVRVGGYLTGDSSPAFRVPVGVDATAVRDGLAAIYDRLDTLPLQPGGSADPNLAEAFRKGQLIEATQADPNVRTLPDDSGIVLLDPQGQPLMLGDRPATFTWDQLIHSEDLGQGSDLAPVEGVKGESSLPGGGLMSDRIEAPQDAGLVLASLGYQRSGAESEPAELKIGYQRAGAGLPSEVGVSGLDLTAQEQNLYQHHARNMTTPGMAVQNDDGSTSTVRQLVVERKGRFYSIPSVWDGKIVGEREAMQRAGKAGWDQWPSYATAEEADARYSLMHDFMERDVPEPAQADVAAPDAYSVTDMMPAAALPIPPVRPAKVDPNLPLPPGAKPSSGLRASGPAATAEAKWRGEFSTYLDGLDSGQLHRLVSITQGHTGGFVSPVASGEIREDDHGGGRFHASRPGQSDGLHHGVDFVATPGEIVFAPVTGTVTKLGWVYKGDAHYRYVEIFTPDRKNVRLLYVQPGLSKGQKVYAGISALGAAQDVSKKWGKGMKPHVHVEVREGGAPGSTRGQLVDASDLLKSGDVAVAMIQAAAAKRGVQMASR